MKARKDSEIESEFRPRKKKKKEMEYRKNVCSLSLDCADIERSELFRGQLDRAKQVAKWIERTGQRCAEKEDGKQKKIKRSGWRRGKATNDEQNLNWFFFSITGELTSRRSTQLTVGGGCPVAWHCNSVPVQLEKCTSFGNCVMNTGWRSCDWSSAPTESNANRPTCKKWSWNESITIS